jgi:PAS domain S-box-containing protein
MSINKSKLKLLDFKLEILAIIVALFLVVQLENIETAKIVAEERDRVADQVDILQNRLSSKIFADMHLVEGLRIQLTRNPAWSQRDFAAYVDQLARNYSGFRHVAVAKDYVVVYVAPLGGNETALGLDYRTVSDQLAAVEEVIDQGHTVITNPVDLVQGGKAIIGRVPFFIRDEGPKEIWGLISIVWDLDELFGSFSEVNLNSPYMVAARSVTDNLTESIMVYGDAIVFDRNPVSTILQVEGNAWEVAAVPKAGWPSSSPSIWMIRFAGFLTSALLISLSIGRKRKRANIRVLETEIKLRRRNEEQLRQYAQIVANATDLMALVDDKYVYLAVNDAYLQAINKTSNEVIGQTMAAVFGEEFFNTTMKPQADRCLVGEEVRYQDWFEVETAGRIYMDISYNPYLGPSGNVRGFVVISRDITARKKSEAALLQYREIIESSGDMIALLNIDFEYVITNQAFLGAFGLGTDNLIGRTPVELFGSDIFNSVLKPKLERCLEGEVVKDRSWFEFGDNPKRFLSVIYSPQVSNDNEITGIVFIGRDITDFRQAQEKAQESEEHFQTVFNTVTTGTIEISTEGIIRIFNPAAEAIFGFKSQEVVGKNISMLMPEPDRSKHDSYIQNYLDTGEGKIIGFGRQVTGLRSNGKEFPMQLHIGKMEIGDDTRFVGSVSDLTDVKSLEGQLRHLQKIEAIGNLTGGVAHDFNNLLAIIQGNLMLLKMDLEAGEKIHEEDFEHAINEALDASVRGASLTSRLLAFSRQQVLNPEIIYFDKAVKGVRTLLERTLGEDIEISWQLNANGLTNVDSAQLENALLNLAINARDAMPQGGRLTIATSDVNLDEAFVSATVGARQGEHVKLSVGDSGTGMDDETLQQAIDPFFTTKGVGKGTGLGLSMVYGFVKQSGGHLHIDSQVGVGTTLTICLPRAEGVFTEKAGNDDQTSTSGGTETILVVEDDQGVRKVTVRMLKRLGYVVIEAVDGLTAIQALESNSVIDLIISDIVLPGSMRGTEIVNLARGLRPKLKVIFMSGYTDGALMEQGDHIPDQIFIRKPFSPALLATKVREALDRPKSLII